MSIIVLNLVLLVNSQRGTVTAACNTTVPHMSSEVLRHDKTPDPLMPSSSDLELYVWTLYSWTSTQYIRSPKLGYIRTI